MGLKLPSVPLKEGPTGTPTPLFVNFVVSVHIDAELAEKEAADWAKADAEERGNREERKQVALARAIKTAEVRAGPFHAEPLLGALLQGRVVSLHSRENGVPFPASKLLDHAPSPLFSSATWGLPSTCRLCFLACPGPVCLYLTDLSCSRTHTHTTANPVPFPPLPRRPVWRTFPRWRPR